MAARIVRVCGRWRRQHDPPGSLVAAALVAVLAAGVVSGACAEWNVYPGEGTPIRGRDLRRRGYELCARGTNAHECGCGDGAGVRTADTKILM